MEYFAIPLYKGIARKTKKNIDNMYYIKIISNNLVYKGLISKTLFIIIVSELALNYDEC